MFLIQGSNLNFLHWQADSLPLAPPGESLVSLLEDVLLSAAEGAVLGWKGVITKQIAGPHSKGTDIVSLQPEFMCRLL